MKLLALGLKAKRILIASGDGNEFRLTWKAFCRHAIFRWRHPLPTDHYDFLMPQEQAWNGEQVLILQSAEPAYVLRALDRLGEKPLFRNPRYTLFCRNRPEVVKRFEGHPMLCRIWPHTEACDGWKHLRNLRRLGFDAVVLFLTGDPSYRKIKLFAFLLGVPARRMLVFNEAIDCFFLKLHPWLKLVSHRFRGRPPSEAWSPWRQSAYVAASLTLKSGLLPFRFLWLLWVWFRLRLAGLRSSRKSHDHSLRLPLFPGA
jgi:hypothetical protein